MVAIGLALLALAGAAAIGAFTLREAEAALWIVAAALGLLSLPFLGWGFWRAGHERVKGSGPMVGGDEQRAEAEQNSGAFVAHDVQAQNVAGRDIINPPPPPDPLAALDWWKHPDGPAFSVSPGVEQVREQGAFKLGMSFYMDRGRAGRPAVRWVGEGITPAAAWTLMPENAGRDPRDKYQVKGPPVKPRADAADYDFEVTFMWIDGQTHGCAWRWTIARHVNGHWIMNNEAVNVFEPRVRW